jgi:hypothetical protein
MLPLPPWADSTAALAARFGAARLRLGGGRAGPCRADLPGADGPPPAPPGLVLTTSKEMNTSPHASFVSISSENASHLELRFRAKSGRKDRLTASEPMHPEPDFFANFRQFQMLTSKVSPATTFLKVKFWFHTGDKVFFIGLLENDWSPMVTFANGSGVPGRLVVVLAIGSRPQKSRSQEYAEREEFKSEFKRTEIGVRLVLKGGHEKHGRHHGG